MAYATTQQLKDNLGISGSDQDGFLADLLTRATAAIETFLGRKYSSGDTTVTNELYERQGRIFWLRNLGITEITTLEVRDYRTESWVTLDSDTFDWTSGGRIELNTASTFVRVTYKYSSGSVPADVEAACIAIASAYYLERGENGPVRSERIGDLSFSYDASEDPKQQVEKALATIDAYRVRHV